jgi:hypothetical protein
MTLNYVTAILPRIHVGEPIKSNIVGFGPGVGLHAAHIEPGVFQSLAHIADTGELRVPMLDGDNRRYNVGRYPKDVILGRLP